MRARARAALWLVAVAAAGPVPLAPAAAAGCVKVVVDYGTVSGYGTPPSTSPDTRCVNVGDDAVAAEALTGRARYKGDFLCALDGYPESGCGDHGTEPYWSFWVFKDGRWVYASEGVATYRVGDTDRDGHPDPLGFRYVAFDGRAAPRATPAYPKPAPATKPPAPPAPPPSTAAPKPGRGTVTSAPARPAATAGGPTATGGAAHATGAPGAPAGSPTVRAAAPASAPARPDVVTAPVTGGPPSGQPGTGATRRAAHAPFPWGAVLGGLVALALLGAAALRSRGPGTP